MNIRILFFSLCICLGFFSGCGQDNGNASAVKGDPSSKNEDGPVEYQMTKEESFEAGKWKGKSQDILINDALRMDRGALYMLGACFLMGWGWAIDTETAKLHFAQSASLGFAPALDQLREFYLLDQKNTFLALVYTNLIISQGHEEFVDFYHKMRRDILADFAMGGEKIMQEIERLAIRKRALIQKNNDALKNYSGSDADRKWHLLPMSDITYEDLVFDQAYWQMIWQGRVLCDNDIFFACS